ncbi:hypothetical protein XH88_27470 [Bradyrhizobium sp. CCBAU 51627]|nr:hypothetical protein [Bradyrhizobium sp. CCBAU 51627]
MRTKLNPCNLALMRGRWGPLSAGDRHRCGRKALRRWTSLKGGQCSAAADQRNTAPLAAATFEATGRALPQNDQCEQAGAKQGDAHQCNRQKSKRSEFFTHVRVPRGHHAPIITRVAMLKAEQHKMMTGVTKFR